MIEFAKEFSAAKEPHPSEVRSGAGHADSLDSLDLHAPIIHAPPKHNTSTPNFQVRIEHLQIAVYTTGPATHREGRHLGPVT